MTPDARKTSEPDYVGSPQLREMLETIKVLYPASPVEVKRLDGKMPGLRFLPSRSRPRLAVPSTGGPAIALALHRPSAGDSAWGSARRRVLSTALSSRIGPRIMPYGVALPDLRGSLEQYLSEVLDREVSIALMVGSGRANSKPVLNVFASDGSEIGFAKVGLTQLASELVKAETKALRVLADVDPAAIRVPEVLHAGAWENNPVLLMTALRPPSMRCQLEVPLIAARTIGQSGPTRRFTVLESPWLERLLSALEHSGGPAELLLADRIYALAQSDAGVLLGFGPWHGDFGPWNMAGTPGAPMVWDWERYGDEVPLGLDAIHFGAHRRMRHIDNINEALAGLQAATLPELATLHPHAQKHEALRAVKWTYVATLASRFILDGAASGEQATLAMGHWHSEILEHLLRHQVLDTQEES